MSLGREIRSKMGSVKNTQKITGAMELVAASKMRRAQDRMSLSRPYAKSIREVICHVAESHSEYYHDYLVHRDNPKRVGYIVISSDRGLCGGLNINLFKQTVKSMKEWNDRGVEVDVCAIGSKAEVFFKRHNANLIGHASHLGDSPSVTDIIGVVKVMLDAYEEGKIDVIHLAYNTFVNTMTQTPTVQQLVPATMSSEEEAEGSVKGHWDYIYEPDAKQLLDMLLVRYIEMQVYQSVVDNIACEQASRMVAMKSATDNAGDLLDELHLVYNKARQAAITQEISEIVSGAAAIE